MSMLTERLTILLSRAALRTGYLQLSFDALAWFTWLLKRARPEAWPELPLTHWRDPEFLQQLFWAAWYLDGRGIRYQRDVAMLECSEIEALYNLRQLPHETRHSLSALIAPSIDAFARWAYAFTKGMTMRASLARDPAEDCAWIFRDLFALAAHGRVAFRVELAAWPKIIARLREEFPNVFPASDPSEPDMAAWPEWLNDAMDLAVFRDKTITLTCDELLEVTNADAQRLLGEIDIFTRRRLAPVVARLTELSDATPDTERQPDGIA